MASPVQALAAGAHQPQSAAQPQANQPAAARHFNCDTFKFARLCTVFERLAASQQKVDRSEELVRLWNYLPKFDLHQHWSLNRLLMPQLDKARHSYQLKEVTIGECFIAALGLAKQSPEANRLRNWKAPVSATAQAARRNQREPSIKVPAAGDFTTVLFEILFRRCDVQMTTSKATIAQVNEKLDTLSKTSLRAERTPIFVWCLTSLSACECMWFTRIILKQLQCRMTPESMLKFYHKRAISIYNQTSDLRLVCELVCDPERMAREASGVILHQPCKPQLCDSPSWLQLLHKMKKHHEETTSNAIKFTSFVIEDKYDGERMLVHYTPPKVAGDQAKINIFSRNSIDFGSNRGSARFDYETAMRPYITEALGDSECLIDGEMIAMDTNTRRCNPFGGNRSVAQNFQRAEAVGTQIVYHAFDLLFLNGKSIIEQPLMERRRLLMLTVKPITFRFEIVPQSVCQLDQLDLEALQAEKLTASSLASESKGAVEVSLASKLRHASLFMMDQLEDSLRRGMEGIVIKNAHAPYELNARNPSWAKLKPDWVDGMTESFDVIILGGYFGDGHRRSGNLSHFLVGVADDTHNYAPNCPTMFYTSGKVGSGYTLAQLAQLQNHLDGKWHKYDTASPPPHLMGWQCQKSDIPDAWIAPSESVIIEMKCNEITPCLRNKFHAEFTYRFPRLQRIRYDKPWYDCMTITQLLQLASKPRYKPNHKNKPKQQQQGQGKEDKYIMSPSSGARNADDQQADEMQLDEQSTGLASAAESALPASESMGLAPDQTAHADSGWASAFDEANAPSAGQDGGQDAQAGRRGTKRRKGVTVARPRAAQGVISLFAPADFTSVPRVSLLFDGLSFVVLSGDPIRPTKGELEKLCVAHGATVTPNAVPHTTFAILAAKSKSARLQVAIQAKQYGVLHYSWLQDSIAQNVRLPFTANDSYLLSGTAETCAAIAAQQDQYGDSYTEHTDAKSLEKILLKVDKELDKRRLDQEAKQQEEASKPPPAHSLSLVAHPENQDDDMSDESAPLAKQEPHKKPRKSLRSKLEANAHKTTSAAESNSNSAPKESDTASAVLPGDSIRSNQLSEEEQAQLDSLPGRLFAQCRIFFSQPLPQANAATGERSIHRSDSITNLTSAAASSAELLLLARTAAQMHSGTIVSRLDDTCTHHVADPSSNQRQSMYDEESSSSIVTVSPSWVLDSCIAQQLLPVSDYRLPRPEQH